MEHCKDKKENRLTYHKTTEEEKYLISEWKYEGDYAIYNMGSYEEQKKKGCGFANPKNNFYSFYDEKILIGFINLQEKETKVFLGIGVKPDDCNKGYGRKIIQSAHKISLHLFPGKQLYLEVRTWNTRAAKCYEKVGFYIEGEPFQRITPIGEGMFYRMIKESE